MGHPREALPFAEKAQALLVRPGKELPDVTVEALGRLVPWAMASSIIGTLRRETGRLNDAEISLRDALETVRRQVELYPESAPYRLALADSLVELGLLELHTGRVPAARERLREATGIVRELSGGKPMEPIHQADLAHAETSLAAWETWEKRYDEAERWLRQAEATLRQHVREYPELVERAQFLARVCHSSGTLARQRRAVEEAVRWFEEAVEIEERLVRDRPQLALDRQRFAEYSTDLGDALRTANRRSEAREALDKAAVYFNTVSQPLPDQLCGLARLRAAIAALNSGEPAQAPSGDNAPTQRAADEAMQALRKAVEAGHRCPLPIDRDPVFEPIRSRDEFRALVRRLEGDSPTVKSGQ